MYKTTVEIDGMMCKMCEKHMTEAFESAFKTKSVVSSHEEKKSEILSADKLDEEKIKDVVAKTGYTFMAVTTEEVPEEKKGIFNIFKK